MVAVSSSAEYDFFFLNVLYHFITFFCIYLDSLKYGDCFFFLNNYFIFQIFCFIYEFTQIDLEMGVP